MASALHDMHKQPWPPPPPPPSPLERTPPDGRRADCGEVGPVRRVEGGGAAEQRAPFRARRLVRQAAAANAIGRQMNEREGGRERRTERGTRRLACKTSPCPDKPRTYGRTDGRTAERSAWVVLSASLPPRARPLAVEPIRPGLACAPPAVRPLRACGRWRSPSSSSRPPFVNGHV